MKERPILFSAAMVRAILAGTKTQTRRVMANQPLWDATAQPPGWQWIGKKPGEPNLFKWTDEARFARNLSERAVSPYGQPGDRLWVRETHYAWGHWTKRHNKAKRREEWHFVDETIGTGKAYRYDAEEKLPRRKRELHEVAWWKRPAIFMPRAAVRLALNITAVRVERLQAISDADAQAEGCAYSERFRGYCVGEAEHFNSHDPRQSYFSLWAAINGPNSVDANPWVWVVEFTRAAS